MCAVGCCDHFKRCLIEISTGAALSNMVHGHGTWSVLHNSLSFHLLSIHLPNHLSPSISSNIVFSFLPLIPSILLFSPSYSKYLTLSKVNQRPIPVPSDERTLENVEDKTLVLGELLADKGDLEFYHYIKIGQPVGLTCTYCLSSPLFSYPMKPCLPQWLSSKESTCKARDAGDTGSIPGSGRAPREGIGNPLECSFLKNPMDRGA